MKARIHTSTMHDASIAYELEQKTFVLLSERFERKKHSFNYDQIIPIYQQHTKNNESGLGDIIAYQPFQEIHHHLAHAACSYFTSPFEDAAILIVDGMGPYIDDYYSSTSLWYASENAIKLLEIDKEMDFCFNSLGHFYSAITYYCGFSFWHEGKTMGLAPYGGPGKISENLDALVKFEDNGKFVIDKNFIGFCFALKYKDDSYFDKYRNNQIQEYFENLFGPVRHSGQPLQKNHEDLAWAGQDLLERLMLHLVLHLKKITKTNNLCLGGGVALNSVSNSKIIKTKLFESVHIPPCCGDDGQALGKFLYQKYAINREGGRKSLKNAYLGIEYTKDDIIKALDNNMQHISFVNYSTAELVANTAKLLAEGKIIGWFQGRSEIGPRALGHRSILADPRKAEMKDIINMRIKHREPFRPFAPSILYEYTDEYFFDAHEAPFMLNILQAKEIAINSIPAVIHVDGTARVQTVTKEDNDRYYDLIKSFNKLTGIPVVLNTSFNDNEEPIVESPTDAIRAFLSLDLDVLVIGDYICLKK